MGPGRRSISKIFVSISFRLIIAENAFDLDREANPECGYFDVLAILQNGGAWHGETPGDTGGQP